MKQNIVLCLSKKDIDIINAMGNFDNHIVMDDDTLCIPLFIDSICQRAGARPAYLDKDYKNIVWEYYLK